MTVYDQLRILSQQFPNAEELAVSRELADAFETELAGNVRFGAAGADGPLYRPIIRQVGNLNVIDTGLRYRGKMLVRTEVRQ